MKKAAWIVALALVAVAASAGLTITGKRIIADGGYQALPVKRAPACVLETMGLWVTELPEGASSARLCWCDGDKWYQVAPSPGGACG